MLTVARIKVRKNLKGEVISEEILQEMPEQVPAVLAALGPHICGQAESRSEIPPVLRGVAK